MCSTKDVRYGGDKKRVRRAVDASSSASPGLSALATAIEGDEGHAVAASRPSAQLRQLESRNQVIHELARLGRDMLT